MMCLEDGRMRLERTREVVMVGGGTERVVASSPRN